MYYSDIGENMRIKMSFISLAVLLVASFYAFGAVNESDLTTSTYLGGRGSADAVRGAVFLSDGRIVLAANIGDAEPGGMQASLLDGAARHWGGALIYLTPDGMHVLKVTRLAKRVLDIDIDGNDNIYVAAWDRGLLKLDADAGRILWKRQFAGRNVWRVAAGENGFNVVLTHGTRHDNPDRHSPGSGHIYLHDAAGKLVNDFGGYRNTLDVTVHEPSETVIHIGWRQTRSWEGTRVFPVQIAYLRGVGFDGEVKYLGYDWSTDRESPRFLNRPENNMADTRGIRCSIGQDGLLYVAYESAGGNHIFRYSPFDVSERVEQAGGDRYHSFHNTRSEHKTYFARHDPATGEFLRGQEFTARLSSGAGNAVRPNAITADHEGRVYLGGSSAWGLPLSWMPPDTGEYAGGAWLMIMSSDMNTRLFSTRIAANSTTHAVATRRIGNRQHVVFGGETQAADNFFLKDPLQDEMKDSKTGFYAVFGARGRAPLSTRRPAHSLPVAPVSRPARQLRERGVVQSDYMLLSKLVQMTNENVLGPEPMPLSLTAARVVLLGAEESGRLTFTPATEGATMTAQFEFDELSAQDKANLAILVTTLEPENKGAKGLAAVFLEAAGHTEQADAFFEQAGVFIASEFGKLFVEQ